MNYSSAIKFQLSVDSLYIFIYNTSAGSKPVEGRILPPGLPLAGGRSDTLKILVTGGCGFIGTNFIYHMLEKYEDYRIVNLDALTYAGNKVNLKPLEDNPNYEFVHGDICDVELVDTLVQNVDAIVHFAAESHVDRSIENSSVFIKTNVVGTQVLLEAARRNGSKRFHHISTDEVFGSLGAEGYFDEETPYAPRSPYAASKAAADHLVRAYCVTHNLPVTITNCSNNYGPFQYPEKLIPLFVTNLMEDKQVPVYGEGLNVRDWLHVNDHCEAVDLVLHNGTIGETYCIGGDCEKTNIEITEMLIKSFDKTRDYIRFVKDRKGHDWRYAIDCSKIKSELGWKPVYSFDQGMHSTIQWYQDHQSWWKALKDKRFDLFEKKKG